MARWLVCASRNAYEEAAAIVEAEDESGAEDKFRAMEGAGMHDWSPGGECASSDYDCYSIEQLDDDEPIGVQHDERVTAERAGPELLAAAERVLEWAETTGGWDAPCWKALRAAAEKAKGGLGGWCLIDADGTGLKEIQRDDEAGIFDTDNEALAYVRHRAAAGDYEAAAALQQHDRDAAELAAHRADKGSPVEVWEEECHG